MNHDSIGLKLTFTDYLFSIQQYTIHSFHVNDELAYFWLIFNALLGFQVNILRGILPDQGHQDSLAWLIRGHLQLPSFYALFLVSKYMQFVNRS